MKALLLLGANLGDRAAHLHRAVAAIQEWDGCRVLKRSRIYETAPVGPSESPYLNQAVALETARTPMGLLIEAKILEAAAGRKPGIRWGSRPLDVDVVACGHLRVRTPWLTVPHPRVAERAFALAPLADVAGAWKPDGKRTARQLLDILAPDPKTVRLWFGK
ncbi:MAG: 2-amino-4-hydroxy-6-hydroxymethyldihydropteridine diphosphokinase [Elusimicrobiota bacterium]